jgi:hypothetical protein
MTGVIFSSTTRIAQDRVGLRGCQVLGGGGRVGPTNAIELLPQLIG